MVRWQLVVSKKAVKDARELVQSGLRPQAQRLLKLLQDDPFATPPRFEQLVGNLAGYYSRRINIQHRLIYRVENDQGVVHVLRMWTHYE